MFKFSRSTKITIVCAAETVSVIQYNLYSITKYIIRSKMLFQTNIFLRSHRLVFFIARSF